MGLAVLGMHRSGTSAVTRLLNLMGCSLGPDKSVAAPAHDNTAGFWERLDVRRTNDRLLAALGRSWVDCLTIDLDSVVSSEVREFAWSAKKIVGELDSSQPWVLKDPRFCLTLPAWKPFVDPLITVYVHRDPMASALSLRKRNGIRLPLGLALWEHYNLSALRASSGLPRANIAYEQLTRDPEAAAERLLQQLVDQGATALHLPDRDALLSFVAPALDHHGAEAAAGSEAPPSESIERLSAALRDGSAFRGEVPALSTASAELLRTASAQWPGQTWITRLLRERDAQVAALEQQLIEAQRGRDPSGDGPA